MGGVAGSAAGGAAAGGVLESAIGAWSIGVAGVVSVAGVGAIGAVVGAVVSPGGVGAVAAGALDEGGIISLAPVPAAGVIPAPLEALLGIT